MINFFYFQKKEEIGLCKMLLYRNCPLISFSLLSLSLSLSHIVQRTKALQLDRDGDGRISSAELMRVMKV